MATWNTTIARPKLQTQVVKWMEPLYSTEDVTLGPLVAPLDTGTVLGQITATGQWVPLAPAAADGSQVAAGVLLEAMPINASPTLHVPVIVRQAVVQASGLIWPAGITAPQIATATGQLFTGGNGITQGVVIHSS
jgi:hypothetical protein